MRSKNKLKRFFAVLLVAAMISSVCFSIHVFAVNSVDSLQQNAESIKQRIDEANKEIERLGKMSKESNEYLKAVNVKIELVQSEVDALNAQIKPLEKEIKSLEFKINDSNSQIAEMEQQLPLLDTQFNKCFDEYGQRMRAIYITGSVTNLELMLTSRDVSSLFTRAEMIRSVSKKDANALNELTDTMKEINDKKEKINVEKMALETNKVTFLTSKTKLDEALESVNQKKATLVADKNEVDAIVRKIAVETGEHTDAISEDQDILDQIDKDIMDAIAKAEKDLETTTTTTTTKPPITTTGPNGETEKPPVTTKPPVITTSPSTGTGVFTIPCPSYRNISARFPSYSSGAKHTGLDFAASTGTGIVAADSGTVITSVDLTVSYGKYIVIRHKQGLYTLYAHSSKRLVEVGDVVAKGQKIAEVGTTGNSTGPHLHFEVRTGGGGYSDCVNPELPQYLGSVPYSR